MIKAILLDLCGRASERDIVLSAIVNQAVVQTGSREGCPERRTQGADGGAGGEGVLIAINPVLFGIVASVESE